MKTFEEFNKNDPYGEEDWNPAHEQVVTSMSNIYLCTQDYENFESGNVYIIMGIYQAGNIGTNVKVKGKNINQNIQMEFAPDEDPFMKAQVDESMIYIGKLDR